MTPTLPVAICLILGTAFLSAQDPAAPPPPAAPLLVRPDPATPPPAIERPLAGETQPAPARTPVPPPVSIEIPSENSLTSETRRVGDHTLTIEQVAPVDLPPPPIPVAAPPPDPAKAAAFRSRLATLPKRRNIIISTTVYDHRATLVRWSGGSPARAFEAWSNVDFSFLRSLGSIRLGGDELHFLYLGFGRVDTEKTAAFFARRGRLWLKPAIPELPATPETDPAFIVVKGDPTPAELAGLTALHSLYKAEHVRLKTANEFICRINAQRAAELAANPHPPQDLIIKHWNTTGQVTLPATPQPDAANKEGEAR